MILGRVRRRKSEVFDREVLHKSRFGINKYPMLKKIDRFWSHFGEIWASILAQKAVKIVSERQQQTDVILGTFFSMNGKRSGGMRGPALDA